MIQMLTSITLDPQTVKPVTRPLVTKGRFAQNGISGSSEEYGDEMAALGTEMDSVDLIWY